ncbi:hypothetical protein GOBAR_DD21394 [Gossypium barbadense]|nr:hypothetical protein GOBAR_DD21394 [Gossypium barbadense]
MRSSLRNSQSFFTSLIFLALIISLIENVKSLYGSREYFLIATVPSNNAGGGSGVVLSDSMMESERPGEEKKNRWEANAAAKSGCQSASDSE